MPSYFFGSSSARSEITIWELSAPRPIDDQKQELKNYQFKLTYRPNKILRKLIYGLHYSRGIGTNYFTQYNFNIGIMSEPFDQLKLNVFLDYRIKYLDPKESDNDLFFRAQMEYDIQ